MVARWKPLRRPLISAATAFGGVQLSCEQGPRNPIHPDPMWMLGPALARLVGTGVEASDYLLDGRRRVA